MAQRRQYNFRATPRVEKSLAEVRAKGDEQTKFINAAMELAVTAHEALGADFWKIRAMAEKAGIAEGAMLGRLALAGLKGKR